MGVYRSLGGPGCASWKDVETSELPVGHTGFGAILERAWVAGGSLVTG